MAFLYDARRVPVNLLTLRDRAVGRPRGGRCGQMVENVERHLHEGKRPVQAAIDAAWGWSARSSRDDHAGRRLRAHRIQGGLTGSLFARPRSRSRSRHRVGNRRPDASPMMGSRLLSGRYGRGLPADQPALRSVRGGYRRAERDSGLSAGRPHAVMSRSSPCRFTCPAARAGSGRGPGASSSASSGPLNSTLDQTKRPIVRSTTSTGHSPKAPAPSS